MYTTLVSAILALSSLVSAAPVCSFQTPASVANARAKFAAAKISPDVVKPFHPTLDVFPSYGSTPVNFGNEINTLEPEFPFSAEPGFDPATTKYFKFIIDPDAPGPDGTPQNILTGVISDFLHLAVKDASPSCIDPSSAGKVVRPYLSPTPLSVASHRYIFLVYRQPAGFEAPLDLSLTIAGLKLQEFVDKYGLVLVGGNYFNQGLGTNLGGIGTTGPL